VNWCAKRATINGSYDKENLYHWLALYRRRPHVIVDRQAVACLMLPQKRERAEVFVHHHKRAALVPPAGTITPKN
jgi:hypothetical protein